MTDCAYHVNSTCHKNNTSCTGCPDALLRTDSKFHKKWLDSLRIVDRDRQPTHSLRNVLAGRAAFLMGGGPSANSEPLALLARRGCFTLAVNNVAGHPLVRPQAFVCSDPPKKFSASIWRDPAIIKFVPSVKLSGRRGDLREKVDGKFRKMNKRVDKCPNVWGFARHSHMTPDDEFFISEGAMWGNHDAGCTRTGQPKTVCTLLLGIRLLKYLGAGTIYLVGVDFTMTPDAGYSFSQDRTQGACESNTQQFGIVNKWLCQMQEDGVFERFGVELYNTNPRSGLRAFSHVPFEDAVGLACEGIEEVPDLKSWYEK